MNEDPCLCLPTCVMETIHCKGALLEPDLPFRPISGPWEEEAGEVGGLCPDSLPSIPASGREDEDRGRRPGPSLLRQASSQRPDLAGLFQQMAQFPLVFVVQTIPDKS